MKKYLFKSVLCKSYLKKVHDGVCIEKIEADKSQDGKEHYMIHSHPCNGVDEDIESPCEGAFDVEKTYYKICEKSWFTGFVVGFKDIVTEGYLGVDTNYHYNGSEYTTVFKHPKTIIKCAIVYFGNNRKRFVPVDDIEFI